MILAALTFFLSIDGGTCADVRCVDDIPAPTQTVRPTATPRPSPTPGSNCKVIPAGGNFDFVPIAPGATHSYCFDTAVPMGRVEVSTYDRSGVNLCASVLLRVTSPVGTSYSAGPGTNASQTVRFYRTSTTMLPAGRWMVSVTGASGSCPQGKYRVDWRSY